MRQADAFTTLPKARKSRQEINAGFGTSSRVLLNPRFALECGRASPYLGQLQ